MPQNYLTVSEAADMIIRIGRSMSLSRFVAANDGNITVRVADDAILATPTGVNKGELAPEMLLRVRISDGKILEGTWKPTTELEMHLNVYRADDEIVSTAHAHPVYLTTLACAGIELDLPSNTSACCVTGRVPVVPFICSGSPELAKSVIPYVKKYHVINLGNHGPISWGKTPIEAWYRLECAEASAHLALELARLGRFRPINGAQVREMISYHHLDFTPEGTVAAWEGEENQQPAVTFTEYLRSLTEPQ